MSAITIRSREPDMPKREDGATHTPGPWSISDMFFDVTTIREGRPTVVARTMRQSPRAPGCPIGDAEAEANARLMAAAPAMYEALLAVTKCGNGGARLSRDASDKARAALAAATPRDGG